MQPKYIETEIIADPVEVENVLADFNLTVSGILSVRDAARSHFLDAGPLMAINAPGTLAYHYGIQEIRVQFLGKHYKVDRSGGVEAIVSHDGLRKIVFQNVDLACSKSFEPRPRSEKGAGFEQACVGNLFDYAGVNLPRKVRPDSSHTAVLFVMVDERGAVEVSRPVVSSGGFSGFVQRIWVSDGSDLESSVHRKPLLSPVEDFHVAVTRR